MALTLPEGDDFLDSAAAVRAKTERERVMETYLKALDGVKKFVGSVLKKLEEVSNLNDATLLTVARDIFEEFERNTGSTFFSEQTEQNFQKIGIILEILENGLAQGSIKMITGNLEIVVWRGVTQDQLDTLMNNLRTHLINLQKYLKENYDELAVPSPS